MKRTCLIAFTLLFITLSNLYASKKPTLIIYCGITMVKPITEIAKIIEKKHNCNIKISQGGSKDLYEALKYSKKGDLYLPGSESYRKNNLRDGLLQEGVYIGYNQAALFVQKENTSIKSLDDLINPEVSTILCNADSGSIGRMSKKVILKAKGEEFYNQAFDNAVEIGTDSRNLNKALIEDRAQLAINWKATASWPENSPYMKTIAIDEKYAPKKKLILNQLSFSQHPKIAKDFMEYAASPKGQAIMRKYGFQD